MSTFANYLDKLHTSFTAAAAKNGVYVVDDGPKSLNISDKKKINLSKVFEVAQKHINEIKGNSTQTKDAEQKKTLVTKISLAEEDTKKLYEKYEQKTKGLCRRFLKAINYYAPDFLKNWFPRVFSNTIQENENYTKRTYSLLLTKLQGFKEELSKAEPEAPKPPAPNNPAHPKPVSKPGEKKPKEKPSPIIPPALKPAQKAKEKPSPIQPPAPKPHEQRKQPSPAPANPFPTPVTQGPLPPIAEGSDEEPDSGKKKRKRDFDGVTRKLEFGKTLPELDYQAIRASESEKLINLIQACAKILNDPQTGYQKFRATLLELASNLKKLSLVYPYLSDVNIREKYKDINALQLLTIEFDDTDATINEKLQETKFVAHFNELLKEHTELEIGIKLLLGKEEPILKGLDGNKKNKKDYERFTGTIAVPANLFEKLKVFKSETPNFSPSSIKVKGSEFTKELLKNLLEVATFLPSVKMILLHEITVIDLHQLGLSAEEEKQFLALLPSLQFKTTITLKLTEHPKAEYSPKQFSDLLKICPTIDFLKDCFKYCSKQDEIELPIALLVSPMLNFSDFTFEQVARLLPRFSNIQWLILNLVDLEDCHIKTWIDNGLFHRIKSLNFQKCSLSTDIFTILKDLTTLRKLMIGSELEEGVTPNLPKFDDPFKIATLYSVNSTTAATARKLYTGPSDCARVFQIPFAAAGHKAVFSDHDIVMDPYSANAWLKNDNYKNIELAPSFQTVLMDYSEFINDDYVIEFMKKFPNAKLFSFCCCPNLTNAGLQKIFTYLAESKIKRLDFTGCAQITWEPILGNIDQIRGLNKLFLTGTGVIPQTLKDFIGEQQDLTKIIECTPYTLKIENADILNLETFLKARNLSTLVHLDFEDCTDLTDEALIKILDRLITDDVVDDAAGKNKVKNPQKLNVISINLSGCTKITNAAFELAKNAEGKVNIKHLGSVLKVKTNKTELSPEIKLVYLNKFGVEFTEDTLNLKMNTCELQEALDRCLFDGQPPFDIDDQKYKTFNFTLKRTMKDEGSTLQTNKNSIYAISYKIRNQMRRGMHLSSSDFLNQNISPQVAEVIFNIIKGVKIDRQLHWQVAADATEICHPLCLNLPYFHFDRLKEIFLTNFDVNKVDELDDMFVRAIRLDLEGKRVFEEAVKRFSPLICALLDSDIDRKLVTKITRLANQGGRELPEVRKHPKVKAELLRLNEKKAKKLQKEMQQKAFAEAAEGDEELARQLANQADPDQMRRDAELARQLANE